MEGKVLHGGAGGNAQKSEKSSECVCMSVCACVCGCVLLCAYVLKSQGNAQKSDKLSQCNKHIHRYKIHAAHVSDVNLCVDLDVHASGSLWIWSGYGQ